MSVRANMAEPTTNASVRSRHSILCAAVVLLALVIVPAPLMPPFGLPGKVQSMLGISWTAAFLVSMIALQGSLYGSLGVLAAFAVKPERTWRRHWLQLALVPLGVTGIALVVRSIKLGHVPMLANAAVPMAACGLGVVTGLMVRRQGWRATLVAGVVLVAGLLCAYWPGVSSGLSREVEAQLRRLAGASPGSSGDERFGVLLRTVFAEMASASAVEHNRAAILALGIAIGHERLARLAGLERENEWLRQACAWRAGTTLRGREDWARHYCLSAALVVVGSPILSDAGGLIKEQLDALPRGSGFSFGDLAADRAGVRFARVATHSEQSARSLQARVKNGFSVDDFFPPASSLPENLTLEQFRRDYGGVGSLRYRRTVGEIDARLDRCAGLVFQ